VDPQKSLKEDGGLWGLVILAILLVGSYYGWYHVFQGQDDSATWVFDGVKESRITEISLVEDNQPAWTVKREDQSWAIKTPAGVRIDSASVNRLIQSLLDLSPKMRVDAQPGEDYGTNSTGTYLNIKTSGGRHRLYFGTDRPTGGGKYLVYGAADRTVFVVPQQDYDALKQRLYDLRRKELFSTSVGAVESFTLSGTSETVTYRRENNGWSVPGETTLNDTHVKSLKSDLRTFLFLTAEQFHDTRPERLGTTTASITLGTGDETVELEIGRVRNDRRVVRREGWPVVSVKKDPVKIFRDLPNVPADWPDAVETDGPETAEGSQPPGGLPDFGNINQP